MLKWLALATVLGLVVGAFIAKGNNDVRRD